MNRLRILLVLGVLALIVALVPAATAQDQTFGLSAGDFALLTGANANTSAATNFDYAFTLRLDANASGDAVNVALDGAGSVADGFSLDLTGAISTPDGDTPANLGVVVSGESLYLSLDSGASWYGATMEELGTTFGSMMGGMLPFDPAELASGDMSGLEDQMGSMSGMMSGLESLDPASFIHITSAPAADGTTQFTIDLDIVTLVSSPEISQLLGAAMVGSGGMGMDTSAATPSPDELAMMGQMVGGMLADATLSVTQYVDPAAQIVTRTVVDLGFPLDALTGAGDSLTLNFDLSLSNYGAAQAVQAPADAQPLEELMSGMSAGM